MKFSQTVSASRRKCRKAHFAATSDVRRVLMSSPLSGELRKKYKVRSLPIRKDDEVEVASGHYKGRTGKVVGCYRKKFAVYVENVTRETCKQQSVHVKIAASNVVITRPKLDKDRKALLERRKNQKA